jgi:hypothetical protein
MSDRRLIGLVVAGMIGLVAAPGAGGSAQAGTVPQTGRFAETTGGIHVFNDQIDLYYASDELIAFVAAHNDGAQKIPVDVTRRLRAANPSFAVLHYRLGYGLGYRITQDGCDPSGEYLMIMDGLDWSREWPEAELPEDYFYHYGGKRLYMCGWGWYVMDTDNPGWRAWWLDRVRTQLAQGEYDGLFADSVSVPNFLGSESFRPVLPALDEAFEADWTRRLNDWLAWLDAELGDEYLLIPNAGAWITGRDRVNYGLTDGVMIEAFAGWGWSDRFPVEDWELQLDRMLALINQDKIVIAQSYVEDFRDQVWVMANYLLVKGRFTYVNIDVGTEAEWFPLYALPIGLPVGAPPAQVRDLYDSASGLYRREYENAVILVNPDPAGEARTLTLDAPLVLVSGERGGGMLPEDGDVSGWTLLTESVETVSVEPGGAAILLKHE